MKKTITLFLFIYSIVFDVQAQCTGNVFFPDDNFKRVLIEEHNIDTNSDGEISCEEAYNYRETIDVQGRFISDLTGIEAFVNMKALISKDNDLISLDLSANTALVSLRCNNNNFINIANNNPDLACIQIDDIDSNVHNLADVDDLASFSENCNTNFTQKI